MAAAGPSARAAELKQQLAAAVAAEDYGAAAELKKALKAQEAADEAAAAAASGAAQAAQAAAQANARVAELKRQVQAAVAAGTTKSGGAEGGDEKGRGRGGGAARPPGGARARAGALELMSLAAQGGLTDITAEKKRRRPAAPSSRSRSAR